MTPALNELYAHNDWARDKLLSIAVHLTDAQLDRKFDMGLGALRHTLHHLWAAERVWLDRWIDPSRARFVEFEPELSMTALHERWRQVSVDRAAFVARLTPADLDRSITYQNNKGETNTFVMRPMLLHVVNHGIHHRAQAINMLRHLDASLKPGADYIFMKVEQAGSTPERPDALTPPLDTRTIRDFYAFGDWATGRLLAAAEKLTAEQLDRPFPIGMGSIRKNLVHIRDAEKWWSDNWRDGPSRQFPAADETISIAALRTTFADTARARDAMLASFGDADLNRIVEASPRPGVVRRFSIGVTMLQLCCHGAHHRAQTINMLRHAGGETPATDVLLHVRKP